jgi:2-polyprenyl-3-methyl-5-hydroxy-6-metoxy-1,4-benzoquinol methylase
MTIEDYSKSNLSLYDVITSWHSLEHTYSADDAIKAIKSLLIEGGNLLIAVPTSDGFIFKIAYILKKYFKSAFLMEEIFYSHNENMHFMYMNKVALSYVLEKNGFKVNSCKTIECFDWKNFHKRFSMPFMKYLSKIIWIIPFVLKISKYDNLVIIGYKK